MATAVSIFAAPTIAGGGHGVAIVPVICALFLTESRDVGTVLEVSLISLGCTWFVAFVTCALISSFTTNDRRR